MLRLTICVIALVSQHVVDSDDHPKGHLQPLGRHRPPVGSIEERASFPTPLEMFEKYVRGSKPVIFRGILEKGMLPAYKLWTDSYLRENHGSEYVSVEKGKKENRKWDMLNITMSEFLDKYQEEDIYMVNDASERMAEDINMPSMLLCGGFQRVVQNVIMWFSSGGTKSVLHNDGLDNVNCLIDGEKYLVMIDKKLKADVEETGWILNGQYSQVDVEKVDMYKFPKFRNLPWYEVKMQKGDCIFIPFKWYHHVDSKKGRNLAINVWIHHLSKFNASDCNATPTDENRFVSVAKFLQDNKKIDLRDFFLGELEDKEFIDWSFFEDLLKPSGQERADLKKLFGDLDADGDGKIVEHEVMMADLTRILKQLPTLQELVQGENPYDTSDQEESLAESLDPEDIMEDYTENVFDDVLSEDLEHFVNSPKQTDTSRDEL